MSKFVPLHVISGYSLLKSGLTIKRIETALKKNDYPAMGLTDEGILSGLPPFVHMCKLYNKPYVLGMSINVEGNDLIIYILNEEGYKNAIAISLAIQKEELDLVFLKEHASGLLGVIETNHGLFKEKFLSLDKIDTPFTKYLLDISKMFHIFYLGIEVTSKEDVHYANKIRRFADEYTYECVALPRIKYLKKEDAIILDIVQAIQNNEKLDIKSRNGQEYFFNEPDYHKIYSEVEIDNTNKIVNLSKFDFFMHRGEMLHYTDEHYDEELKEHAYVGLKKLGLEEDERYINRLEYELNTIKSMGYSNYFLLVQDYVTFAKTHDILVGPGRGSAAGSLISYLLNITEVDPLKYDLQFERFLNPNRTTMPDIDVDFLDIKRDEVVQYMRDRYGVERVSNIVAFQTIGAKQALRDIGRIYQYPDRHITLLSKSLGKEDITLGQSYRTNEDFKKLCDSDQYFKEIVSLAGKIEGLPRQSSLHAAGIILNNTDIALSMPITLDFDNNYISQYEFKYLEEQGFLKMDFLGLRNLTTISYCVDLINKNHGLNLDKLHIPFDTPEVYKLIQSGQVIGLFQIETPVMKKGISILKPSCFNDVVALLALNRPGPMSYLKNYALRRDEKEKATYLSEDIKDILAPTYGIIVYQEQINSIAMKVAGMTPGEGDLFRRAISKKDKSILAQSKELFINGCIKNGYDKKVAEEIFETIAKFADYGFNKSHSVAYAMLTCQMAYLKANYPLEFYSAILQTGSTSETKFSEYIYEMKRRGLKILLPDINYSTDVFDIHDGSLLFPLSSIKGVNVNLVSQILEERSHKLFSDFFDFVSRMFSYKINENQIISLINAGVFDKMHSSRASLRTSVKSALQYAELNYREDGQMGLGIASICPPSIIQDEDRPIDNLDLEYEALGIMISSNPIELHKEELKERGVSSIKDASKYGTVKIAGIVRGVKQIKTKKGDLMAVFTIYDDTESIEVTAFPKIYDSARGFIVKNNILIITGRFESRNENINFIADEIQIMEN